MKLFNNCRKDKMIKKYQKILDNQKFYIIWDWSTEKWGTLIRYLINKYLG